MRYGGLWGGAGVALVLAGGAIMDRAGSEQPRAVAAWQQAHAAAQAAQQRVELGAADAFITEQERSQAKAESNDAWITAAAAGQRAIDSGTVDAWSLNIGFALKMLGCAVAVAAMIGEGVGMARAHKKATTPA